MTRFENDPRLTAYALNELDAAEQAELEAILAADPAARAAVASIRTAADRLCASLSAEPTPALDDFRRADLVSALRAAPIRARSASEGLRIDHEPAPAASEALARASGSDSHSTAPTITAPRRLFHPWWLTTSAAAAAVLLAVVGFVAIKTGGDPALPGLDIVGGTAFEVAATDSPAEQPASTPVTRGALQLGSNTRSTVPEKPANTSRSTFLLSVGGQPTPGQFIAPSSGDTEDNLRNNGPDSSTGFGVAGRSSQNRFEFKNWPSVSYGYQIPFGRRGKPGQRMDVRAALKADPGGYFRSGEVVYTQQSAVTPMLGDIPTIGQSVRRHRLNAAGYSAGVDTAEERQDVAELVAVEGMYGPRSPATSPRTMVFKSEGLSANEVQTILSDLGRRESLRADLWSAGTVAEDVIRPHDGAYNFVLNDFRDLAFGLLFTDSYDFDDTSLNLPLAGWEDPAAETYGPVHHNPFLLSSSNPLSTFSIDVDTASYANVRRFLLNGQLPPPAAVRIEECLNYFTYDYPIPRKSVAPVSNQWADEQVSENHRLETGATSESDPPPFSANMEVAACPWAPQNRLVRIGLRGWEPSEDQRPTANLVFLIDVSGSMQPAERLPLVVQSLKLLVERLRADDRIALAVYAGASGLALPSTLVRDRAAIVAALDNLSAGGSTNGGEGINLAYNLAAQNFIEGGINRVILCTDGDFNVGIADRNELQTLIETKAKSGVFLSVLGFGMGNLKDATLETLADRGNGNYAYIDSLDEARKVLVDQMGGTLQTIAKDVKIQVEFNPAAVGAYRLLGYENRMLAAQDFNDDMKDAGEIGAGHTVTALYEVVPAGVAIPEEPDLFTRDTQGSAPRLDAGRTIRARSASEGLTRSLAPALVTDETLARAAGSDFAPTLNDVIPPPPTPIDLSAEAPEDLVPDPAIDPLKYQTPDQLIASHFGGPLELLTLKLRYKAPDSDESRKLEFALEDAAPAFDQASPDFRFAAAVAGFAMNLRGTPHMSGWTLAAVAETALTTMSKDADSHRAEFLALVKQAQALKAAEGR
jgi:secreted protein with Ig-like and vWFA domain